MNTIRLGVSSDILPFTNQQILDADYKFNKFILSTVGLAAKGLVYGAIASLFFVRKTRVIFYGAGFGGGLSFFQEFKKWANSDQKTNLYLCIQNPRL